MSFILLSQKFSLFRSSLQLLTQLPMPCSGAMVGGQETSSPKGQSCRTLNGSPNCTTVPGPSVRTNTHSLLSHAFLFLFPHDSHVSTCWGVRQTLGAGYWFHLSHWINPPGTEQEVILGHLDTDQSLFLLLSWPLVFPRLFSGRKLSSSECEEGTWPSVGKHTRIRAHTHAPSLKHTHSFELQCHKVGEEGFIIILHRYKRYKQYLKNIQIFTVQFPLLLLLVIHICIHTSSR